MDGLGMSILAEGYERGIERGIEQGIERGIEQGIEALVETCWELGVPKTDTIARLMQKFELTKEEAEEAYKHYMK